MKLLFSIIFILSTEIGLGQTFFQKTYSGADYEEATEIVKTQDGGSIISGISKSYSSGQNDMYVLKLDSFGDKVWDRIIGGNDVENANSILETLDGGYVIIGSARSYSGNNDVYVVKLNSIGILQWEKTFGGSGDDDGQTVTQLADSSFIISGNTNSYGSGLFDFYLLRIDKNGGLIFSKTFGGNQADRAWGHITTSSNEILIAGSTFSFGAGGADGYLVKTDINGNLVWSKAYGSNLNDRFFCINGTTDGNYILGGASEASGGGGEDWWFTKISPLGIVELSKTYGGINNDQLYDISEINGGGYIMFGLSNSYNIVNTGNAMLLKANSTGSMLWTKTYSGTEYSMGRSLEVLDEGYLLAGAKGITSNSDIYIVQTTKNGTSNCLETSVTPTQSAFIPSVFNGGTSSLGANESSVSGTNNTTLIDLSIICEASCSLEVTVENDTLNCFGDGDGTLSSILTGGQAPYQYQWNDPLNQLQANALNLNAGTYNILVSDNLGCEANDTAMVVEPQELTLSLQIIQTQEDKCNGSIMAIPNGGTAPYSYLWWGSLPNLNDQSVDSLCENIYCLTLTDLNNCSIDTCVNVTLGINDFEKELNVKIFPNPAETLIQIESNSGNLEYFAIYNLSGQLIASKPLNTSLAVIDVSDYNCGSYLIEIKTASQHGFKQLMIK